MVHWESLNGSGEFRTGAGDVSGRLTSWVGVCSEAALSEVLDLGMWPIDTDFPVNFHSNPRIQHVFLRVADEEKKGPKCTKSMPTQDIQGGGIEIGPMPFGTPHERTVYSG